MEYKNFIFSLNQNVAEISINRPEKANSMDESTWMELKQILLFCTDEPEARVVVIKAEGEKIFSAGIDVMNLLMTLRKTVEDKCEGRLREKLRKFILEYQQIITLLEKCNKPVIAATHGGCIGAGLDLICAADMRFCSSDAYFSIKEIDLAIVADFGTLQRLPKLISDGKARELAYTGRNMLAVEAEKYGLVNAIFPDKKTLHEEVMKIALTIAEKSPLTIRGIKQNILFSRDHNVSDSLEYVANWNASMLFSEDLTRALNALTTKQKPEYEN